MSLPKTVVIIYGNAGGGTPIMQLVPNAALDLPLHILARASSLTETVVVFHPVATLLEDAGVEREVARRLSAGQTEPIDKLRADSSA